MLETNQKDIHNLSHSFKSLDKSGKGRVDLNEILKTLKVNGISRKEAWKLVRTKCGRTAAITCISLAWRMIKC